MSRPVAVDSRTPVAEAVTEQLRVPTVRQAAAGIRLTTGDPGRGGGPAGWRRGETPERETGRDTPLWPWIVSIGFAFLVGWVIPPPGSAHPDDGSTAVVHDAGH